MAFYEWQFALKCSKCNLYMLKLFFTVENYLVSCILHLVYNRYVC